MLIKIRQLLTDLNMSVNGLDVMLIFKARESTESYTFDSSCFIYFGWHMDYSALSICVTLNNELT